MANPTPESLLEQAREKTDESLKSERTRTDEALILDASASETREDKMLESSRDQNDRRQERKRASHDVAREDLRETLESPASIKRTEDALIESERAISDKAIQEERIAADSARLRERRRLRLTAEALLVLERGATDEDLSTERSRFDEELERAEDAHAETQNSLSVRNEYMAIVSHDLRNPLASIAMGSEVLLLRLRAPEIDREAAIRSLSVIQRNTAAMERLIRDLLDAERIEAGKIAVQPARRSIAALLSECDDLFGSVALKNALTLTISAPAGELFAQVDHDRIMQVLSNLIGNALKHTPRGGSVVLEVHASGGRITFTVRDSGPGIPPEQQKKIFEKFSQLETKSRQGLGLGLYISKWIVEAHGGTLSVTSKPGEGCVFTFSVSAA
jgi:signal transduction histidine kinase